MWNAEWRLNQQNRICFVLVDINYQEVPGLGNTFNLFISKNGGAFAPSAGVKSEISDGWYSYLSTAGEADTIGPVAIYITGVGIINQNLEYVVQQRNAACIEFTYTLINSVTLLPVDGAEIWFTTDLVGNNVVWNGDTDAFGIARDETNNLPCLDAGTYYVWATKSGMIANAWPDTETVS